MRYSLRNLRNGKIYLLDAENAARIAAIKKDPDALRDYSEAELKETVGILEVVRNAARAEAVQTKTFNPLFIRWAGLDLAPYNASLKRAATWIAPLVWPCFAVLLGLVLWLGSISEWQILEGAQAALSLEGLALFAVVSPLLKIPHELGHALVARRYDVPLYQAGIVFVGLFPLPFVDASQADVMASRQQRINISLAGIFVDVVIAMVAFIAWHLVDGAALKTLLASVFTLSSLNSILFNGNPFIRLDGYYAFADWIGQRNLSTVSAQVVKSWRKWLTSFGREGATPGRSERGYAVYGLGSAFYKLNILVTIVWIMLPRFFGLGILVALWGAYAMFLSPILRNGVVGPSKEKASMQKIIFRTGALAILAALMFVPLPIFLVRSAALDTGNTYLIQSEERGYLRHFAPAGPVSAEAPLFELENMVLQQDLRNVEGEIETLELLRTSVAQIDPFQTRVAEMQRRGAEGRQANLLDRAAKLDARADGAARFFPAPTVRSGSYISEAQNLGYLLPDAETAVLVVAFPQWRLQALKGSAPEISVLAYRTELAVTDFTIVRSSEPELVDLLVTVPTSPEALHGKAISLKVRMGSQPIYMHIRDGYGRLLQNYRLSRNIQG